MDTKLAGEMRAKGGGAGGVARAAGAKGGAGVAQKAEHSENSGKEKESPRQTDHKPSPADGQPKGKQESRPQPKPISMEPPRLVRRRSKSGYIVTATEDIQAMQTAAILAEFDRMLLEAEGHLKEVVEQPCADVAARLQSCLQAHRNRSCNCFPAMEAYRNCVLRATQNHVDDLAEREPPMMPVVPPQSIPPPAAPPNKQHSNRRWWKFWTWFR
ncbi:uncharacterized protein LOC108094574 [Drosophila ficusphila]|uniref:uncharacterized protein LOC108094574 n=1 Tax=Drosophila ficusphila TaxID=30025 RepID=UPI0007E63FFD|nr:uncharacterized protein LOC108094574 [Drosophila ficusphila]